MKYEVVEPILLAGKPAGQKSPVFNPVFFAPGDVVEILTPADEDGDVLARRDPDGLDQYISSASLVPLG